MIMEKTLSSENKLIIEQAERIRRLGMKYYSKLAKYRFDPDL